MVWPRYIRSLAVLDPAELVVGYVAEHTCNPLITRHGFRLAFPALAASVQMDRIMTTLPDKQDWSSLFTPSNFFLRYDYYLAVDSVAASRMDAASFAGLVMARLRFLVKVHCRRGRTALHHDTAHAHAWCGVVWVGLGWVEWCRIWSVIATCRCPPFIRGRRASARRTPKPGSKWTDTTLDWR